MAPLHSQRLPANTKMALLADISESPSNSDAQRAGWALACSLCSLLVAKFGCCFEAGL